MERSEIYPGAKIGKLTIIKDVDSRRVEIECECGVIQNSMIKNILSGNVDRCRKCLYHRADINGSIDLTDQKFGKWTVLYRTKAQNNGLSIWMCRCDCGTEKPVYATHLKRGNSNACTICNLKSGADHPQYGGMTGHIPNTWWNTTISRRRTSKKRKSMPMEITIEDGNELFIKQNMRCALTGIILTFGTGVNRDAQTASLDRIDSSIGYIKGNIQWLHKDINMLKNTYDQDYFIKMCKMITDYNTLKEKNGCIVCLIN